MNNEKLKEEVKELEKQKQTQTNYTKNIAENSIKIIERTQSQTSGGVVYLLQEKSARKLLALAT